VGVGDGGGFSGAFSFPPFTSLNLLIIFIMYLVTHSLDLLSTG